MSRNPVLIRPIIFIVVILAAVLTGLAIGVLLGPRAPLPAQVATVPTAPLAEPSIVFTPAAFAALAGWSEDRLLESVPALTTSCQVLSNRPPETVIGEGALARPAAAWQKACAALASVPPNDAPALRTVLEQTFAFYEVAARTKDGKTQPVGTFTGYYEAELKGSLTRGGAFQVPIYGVPRDLVSVDLAAFLAQEKTKDQTKDQAQDFPKNLPRQIIGHVVPAKAPDHPAVLMPYFTRQDIDRDKALTGAADVLVWADDPVAVHILHIQGSGRVTLPDGREVRVGFAGHNGHAFRGIGSILLASGALKPGEASMDKVRAWLTAHPKEASEAMNLNARYIFFRLSEAEDDAGPIGALGVPLTAGRSLAVDPKIIPLGAPVWLDTQDPDGVPIRRLMAAQDTGAAITGAVRGDVFWGRGETAFAKAARMKSAGRYTVLIPKETPP